VKVVIAFEALAVTWSPPQIPQQPSAAE
jgi:hypothetical protein